MEICVELMLDHSLDYRVMESINQKTREFSLLEVDRELSECFHGDIGQP